METVMATPRVQEVDLLRSVALVGICLVNVPYLALPIDALAHPPEAGADTVAAFASAALLHGKFFVLFSFLFGWGFGVQLDSAARQGADARGRFMRRLMGLFVIGLAHAWFVFFGDILVLYALLGLALWHLRDALPGRLVRIALRCGALAAVAYAALGAALAFPEAFAPQPGPSGYLGGFGAATAQRLLDWTTSLPFVLLFNGPLAFGAFALGLAAHRSGFLVAGSPLFQRMERALPWLMLVGIPANLLYAVTIGLGPGSVLEGALGMAALALGSPSLAAVYLWATVRLGRALPGLRTAAGRVSLTGYVLQGVLAGLVFNGVGLGLHGQLGGAQLLGVGLGIALAVEFFARIWLARFSTGPLEWLLRRITYGNPPPGVPPTPGKPGIQPGVS
jgi:uncharacterized protein